MAFIFGSMCRCHEFATCVQMCVWVLTSLSAVTWEKQQPSSILAVQGKIALTKPVIDVHRLKSLCKLSGSIWVASIAEILCVFAAFDTTAEASGQHLSLHLLLLFFIFLIVVLYHNSPQGSGSRKTNILFIAQKRKLSWQRIILLSVCENLRRGCRC